MQNPLHRLKFLLTATDEHGVHSPFIFEYITKCLYAKPEYFRQKSINVLFKSVAYFGAERVRLPPAEANPDYIGLTQMASNQEKDCKSDIDQIPPKKIKEQLRLQFPSIRFENGPYDVLFARPSEAENLVGAASYDALNSAEIKSHKNPISFERPVLTKNPTLPKNPTSLKNPTSSENPISFESPSSNETIKLKKTASSEENIHNDSLLLVEGIHNNPTNLLLWEKLKKHPKSTVTVDLYYCGAVFFRREQVEEHFKIRI